jgi:hypothetical protein
MAHLCHSYQILRLSHLFYISMALHSGKLHYFFRLINLCRLYTDFLKALCRLCVDSVQTLCRLCADSVQTLCRLCADYVQTLSRLCADSVQPLCRLCADSVQTLCQFLRFPISLLLGGARTGDRARASPRSLAMFWNDIGNLRK